jgi:hypothetical protein
MKKLLAFVNILLLGVCSVILLTNPVANALDMPIEILTSDYHIWGDISGTLGPSGPASPPTFSQTYDETSGVPINQSISYAPFDETPPSLMASSTTDIMSVGSYTSASSRLGVMNDRSNAFAEATWTFKPLYSDLNLVISGVASQRAFWEGRVSLIDLTTDKEVLNIIYGSLYAGPGNRDITFDEIIAFDLNHMYSFKLFAGSDSADDSNYISLGAKYSVPEPSTMLLIGTGLVVLVGISRRKFRAR